MSDPSARKARAEAARPSGRWLQTMSAAHTRGALLEEQASISCFSRATFDPHANAAVSQGSKARSSSAVRSVDRSSHTELHESAKR